MQQRIGQAAGAAARQRLAVTQLQAPAGPEAAESRLQFPGLRLHAPEAVEEGHTAISPPIQYQVPEALAAEGPVVADLEAQIPAAAAAAETQTQTPQAVPAVLASSSSALRRRQPPQPARPR